MKNTGRKGYTLVELMTVAAIIVVLAAVSMGSFREYVERAEKVELYQKARMIRQALAVYELEDTGGDGWDLSTLEGNEGLYKAMVIPNKKSSAIYPFVSGVTQDCTWFDLRLKKKNGKYTISGFSYETKKYVMMWKDPDNITIRKKE